MSPLDYALRSTTTHLNQGSGSGDYFLLYLFAGMSLLVLIPWALVLLMVIVVKLRGPKPRPALLPLPKPGSRQERQLHKLAMASLSDDLRSMMGREYQNGPIVGRTYVFYQSMWFFGILFIAAGLMIAKVLLWLFIRDAWLALQAAITGQVLPLDPNRLEGWLYAATLVCCFSTFILPFAGGVYLVWRSRLLKWLHLGDYPKLQIDAQGVTDGGFFMPWSAIVSVTRRFERDSKQTIRHHLVLLIREAGLQDREIKVSAAYLDGVPWRKTWQIAPGENFDWTWLHALAAYHHSYYQALRQASPLDACPTNSGLALPGPVSGK